MSVHSRRYRPAVLAAALFCFLTLSGCADAGRDAASSVAVPMVSTPTVHPDPGATPVPTHRPKHQVLSAGTNEGSAYLVVRAGNVLIAGLDTVGVATSMDGGIHWHRASRGLPAAASVLDLSYDRDGRIFALAGADGVFVSGLSTPLQWQRWGQAVPLHTNPVALAYWPAKRTVMLGDGSGAVYTIAEHGSWVAADSGLPVNRQAITRFWLEGKRIWAGLTGGLAMSDDGEHWSIDQRLGVHEVLGLSIVAGGGMAAALDADGLAVRTQPTGNWRFFTVATLGLRPGDRVLSVSYAAKSGRLYLGTLISGVISLRPDGSTIQVVPGVPADDPVNSLLITEGGVLAATNSGVLRLLTSGQ